MWALTNKALTVPPGGVHITPSGIGPGELNAKTFTSTKYPNLIKQSNWQKHEKSMTSLHTFTHTLKGTVHTFTLNIYNNLTKLRGTQVKSALKIPKFTKSIKPVNPVLPVSP